MSLEIPGFRLDPVQQADTEPIIRLVTDALAEYGLPLHLDGIDADLADPVSAYAGSRSGFWTLRDSAGRLVGCCALMEQDTDHVELRRMYLDRSLRGRGLGRALLLAVIHEAKERGFRYIMADTASVLREAVGLYRSVGFAPVSGAVPAEFCDISLGLELN